MEITKRDITKFSNLTFFNVESFYHDELYYFRFINSDLKFINDKKVTDNKKCYFDKMKCNIVSFSNTMSGNQINETLFLKLELDKMITIFNKKRNVNLKNAVSYYLDYLINKAIYFNIYEYSHDFCRIGLISIFGYYNAIPLRSMPGLTKYKVYPFIRYYSGQFYIKNNDKKLVLIND